MFSFLPRRRRRQQQARPVGESLETRSLMTGGAGNIFALVPGAVEKPDEPAVIAFTVDPAQWTLPRRAVMMGFDVAALPKSSVKPNIESVTDAHGKLVSNAFHALTPSQLANLRTGQTPEGPEALLAPVQLRPRGNDAPVTYKVNVTGQLKTTGDFLLGFYLPGDANGNGTVTRDDLAITRSAFGSKSGDQNYRFDADANRDGRIGFIDMAITLQNMGVATTLKPSISVDLDPATDTGAADRMTTSPTARFNGVTSGGATVVFNDPTERVTATVARADTNGNYSIEVPLAEGSNTFQVVVRDSFGQTISGQISPVKRFPAG